jgi:hypothetical protein
MPDSAKSKSPDLEDDLYGLDRIKTDDAFAQSVYAALCNMQWAHEGLDDPWGCSWRRAGGIVAAVRDEGDYMNCYCSGIMRDDGTPEGTVTSDVAQAFAALGWTPVPYPERAGG